jgi:hypothetical protein
MPDRALKSGLFLLLDALHPASGPRKAQAFWRVHAAKIHAPRDPGARILALSADVHCGLRRRPVQTGRAAHQQ